MPHICALDRDCWRDWWQYGMHLRIYFKRCVFNEDRCIIKDHPKHVKFISFNPIPFGNRFASWKFDRAWQKMELVEFQSCKETRCRSG